MPVYIVARFKIHDREAYDRYEAGFAEVFEKFAGKMLSVDEEPAVLQGEWNHTRAVLMEFPDQEAAHEWMTSPEYREIAKDRMAGSDGDVILIKGMKFE